jgi:hypothetical protein
MSWLFNETNSLVMLVLSFVREVSRKEKFWILSFEFGSPGIVVETVVQASGLRGVGRIGLENMSMEMEGI